jgi:integrase
MPRLKITKANVKEIVKPVSGQVDYFDTELSGFGVRATKETLTFFVRSRQRGTNKKPFIPIGVFGLFTTEQARAVAKEYLQRLAAGDDPHPDRQKQLFTLTVEDLHRQYMSTKKTLAPATIRQYTAWMENHFKDWLTLPADTITGSMVLDRLEQMEITNGKSQAINAVKLLRSLFRFGLALHPGVIHRNPVDGVREVRERDWAKKKRRTTFIKPEDLPIWFKAVNAYENPKGRDYMLLLLYTGLRRNEAARLKWSDIDFKRKSFTFTPEKKRGEKPEDDQVTMPMSEQLYKLLLKRRAAGYENEYIFPGKHPSPFLSNPDNYKRDIIAATGVQFCFHDLRRTFITIAESLDVPHYSLKALLNHSMGNDVTGGYIQITTERLREPMQKIADRITELVTVSTPVDNPGLYQTA